jgi:hypothetical protein
MELVSFAAEFVSDASNYAPVAVVTVLGGLILALISTRRAIASPVSFSLVADVLAGSLILGVAVFVWSEELPLILPEPLFWAGIGLTLAIAWPGLWVFALLLRRRQERRELMSGVGLFR